jgi:pilus assembly protein Flp/PilA
MSSLGSAVAYYRFIHCNGGYPMLFLHREDGQGLVEYALILVLVAIVVIAILTLLGPRIGNVFSQITNGLGA